MWEDVRLILSPLLADLENKTKINKTKLNPTQTILVTFISGDLHL